MTIFEYKTSSPIETTKLAEELGERLGPGDVLTLEGDLGAGKTTFTKGLGVGLGVERTINSPTYTIMKEYMGRIPFYHMDVYRLEDSDEDLGFDEFFESDGVTVVEWAHYIQDYLPQERLNITIKYIGETERKIILHASSAHFEEICQGVVE